MFLLKQSIIKFWNWKGIQQLSALTLSLGEAWVQRNVQVWALKCLHIFMQHFLSFVTICFCQGLCLQHYLLHCPITVIWNVCVCVCVPSASHPGPGTEKVLREGWVQHHKRWPTQPLEAALVLSYLRVASLPLGVIRSPVGGASLHILPSVYRARVAGSLSFTGTWPGRRMRVSDQPMVWGLSR